MELALTTGATPSTRADPQGEEAEGGVIVTHHNRDSASCRWTIQHVSKVKQRTLWSKYFQVGGYDWRLLVYPAGDSQALPGYVSLYLQVRSTTMHAFTVEGSRASKSPILKGCSTIIRCCVVASDPPTHNLILQHLREAEIRYCFYAQVTDPRGASSGKWDCFASYRLALVHPTLEAKTISRDSWHRFSGVPLLHPHQQRHFLSSLG